MWGRTAQLWACVLATGQSTHAHPVPAHPLKTSQTRVCAFTRGSCREMLLFIPKTGRGRGLEHECPAVSTARVAASAEPGLTGGTRPHRCPGATACQVLQRPLGTGQSWAYARHVPHAVPSPAASFEAQELDTPSPPAPAAAGTRGGSLQRPPVTPPNHVFSHPFPHVSFLLEMPQGPLACKPGQAQPCGRRHSPKASPPCDRPEPLWLCPRASRPAQSSHCPGWLLALGDPCGVPPGSPSCALVGHGRAGHRPTQTHRQKGLGACGHQSTSSVLSARHCARWLSMSSCTSLQETAVMPPCSAPAPSCASHPMANPASRKA